MIRNFPSTRMRRLRRTDFIRRLVRENRMTPDDLIYPLFVSTNPEDAGPVVSMPGVMRFCLEDLVAECHRARALGIPAVALFPNVPGELKTIDGREAINPDGIVPQAVRAIKSELPDLGVVTDAALDPYTSHGQDGIVDERGVILNDETLEILAQQALVCAAAGADVIAPSDMMDGRIGVIRTVLDENDYSDTIILSYAAKYASAFYGPFRDAVGSATALGKADKRTYQMDPANTDEAIEEVRLDLQEGADMVMVKPGMPYLDVLCRIKNRFHVPTLAYQVSGEYSMLKSAIDKGRVDEAAVLETLLAFKRAGADAVLTYFALRAADMM